MQNLLLDGSLYPTVAYQNFEITELSTSGFNYTIQYQDPAGVDPYPTVSFITGTNQGSASIAARPRKDGVYYVLGEYLFNFPIPPPPPAPQDQPSQVPTGVLPDNSSAASIHLSILFLLLGYLIVLFLQ